jgi:hypothetical protein
MVELGNIVEARVIGNIYDKKKDKTGEKEENHDEIKGGMSK